MSHRDIGPLPVCEGERLVGMLTDRDITWRCWRAAIPDHAGPRRDDPDVYGSRTKTSRTPPA